MQIPVFAKKAIDILEKNGFEAYLVGGCVRNALLGIEISDYDITTSALPSQTKQAFEGYKIFETGIAHGTVTVLIDNNPLEITTFRREAGYSDHRHPDSVRFSKTLNDDLTRRDFTVNSLAFSDKTGVIDLFSGVEDLKSRLIRAVGDASERFDEDALRILRALRFAACLGFSIEEKTGEAIKKDYKLLKFVSIERVYSEIKKLLEGEDAERILNEYKEVFCYILNEERLETDGVNLLPQDYVLRLGFILRNADFRAVLNKLSADNKTKRQIISIEACLNQKNAQTKSEIKFILKNFGIAAYKNSLIIRKALGEDIACIEENLREIEENNECFLLSDLKLSGAELKKLGFSGKEIGRVLDALLELVITEKIKNTPDFLIKEAQRLAIVYQNQ